MSSRPWDPALRVAYKSDPNLNSISYNQDASCIAVGSKYGYSITNCDPFGKVYTKTDEGPVGIVEMLFCTSLVALVGTGDRPNSSTRRLRIVNTKRQSTICELTFPTSILSVKLNRRRLVVVLEEQIYIYDISNMKLLHTIETSANPAAICALAPSSENSYLAYPSPLPSPSTPFANTPPAAASSSQPGDVLLLDALTLSVTNIIQAHKTPLAAIAFNSTGTLLATASDKGTVIRVFGVPNGDKIAQFRRGTKHARIFSISFNAVSTLLSVSSDTDTVHIFKLVKDGAAAKAAAVRKARPASEVDDDVSSTGSSAARFGGQQGGYEAFIDQKRAASAAGIGGSLRKRSLNFGRSLAGAAGGYLPNTLTEMWEPQRDFAFLKLPSAGMRTLVAMSSSTPQVMIVSSEGNFYSYNIDLETGGECVLQKSHSLLEGLDDAA